MAGGYPLDTYGGANVRTFRQRRPLPNLYVPPVQPPQPSYSQGYGSYGGYGGSYGAYSPAAPRPLPDFGMGMAESRAATGRELARELAAQEDEEGSALDFILGSIQKPFDVLWNQGRAIASFATGDLEDAGKAQLRALGSFIPFSETITEAILPEQAERDFAEWLNPTAKFATGDAANTFYGNRVRGRDLGAMAGSLLGEAPTNIDPSGSMFSEFGESTVQDVGTVVGTAAQMVLDPLNLLFGAGTASKALKTGTRLASALPRVASERAMAAIPEIADAVRAANLTQDVINPTTIREALAASGRPLDQVDALMGQLSRKTQEELLGVYRMAPDAQAAAYRQVFQDSANPVLRDLALAESYIPKTGAKSLITAPTFAEQAALGQRTLLGGGPMGQINRMITEPVGMVAKRFDPALTGMSNDEATLNVLTKLNRGFGAGSELFRGFDDTLRRMRLGEITTREAVENTTRLGNTNVGSLLTEREVQDSIGKRLVKLGAAAGAGGAIGGVPGAVVGGLLGLGLPGASRRSATELFRGAFLQDADTAAIQAVSVLSPAIRAQVTPFMGGALRESVGKINATLDKARELGAFDEEQFNRQVAMEVEVGRLRDAAAGGDEASMETLSAIRSDLEAALSRETRPDRIASYQAQLARLDASGVADPLETLIREQAGNAREAQEIILGLRKRHRATVNEVVDPLDYFGRPLSDEFEAFRDENPKLKRAFGEWMPEKSRVQEAKTIEGADAAARAAIRQATGIEVPDNMPIFERNTGRNIQKQLDGATERIIMARMYDAMIEQAGIPPGTQHANEVAETLRQQFRSTVDKAREFSKARLTGGPELPDASKGLTLEVARAIRNRDIRGADATKAMRIAKAIETGNITLEIQAEARALALALRERAPREPVIKALDKVIAAQRAEIANEESAALGAADLLDRQQTRLDAADTVLERRPVEPLPMLIEPRPDTERPGYGGLQDVAEAKTAAETPKAQPEITPAQAWLNEWEAKIAAANYEPDRELTKAIMKSNWRSFMSDKPEGVIDILGAAMAARDEPPVTVARGSRSVANAARAALSGRSADDADAYAAARAAAQEEATEVVVSRKFIADVRDTVLSENEWIATAIDNAIANGDTARATELWREALERYAAGLWGAKDRVREGVHGLARAILSSSGDVDATDYVRLAIANADDESLKRTQGIALDMLEALPDVEAALAVPTKGVRSNDPLMALRAKGAQILNPPASGVVDMARPLPSVDMAEALGEKAVGSVPDRTPKPMPVPRPNYKRVKQEIRGAAATAPGTEFSRLAGLFEAAVQSKADADVIARSAGELRDAAQKALPPGNVQNAANFIEQSLRMFNRTPAEATAIVKRWRSLAPETRAEVSRMLRARRKAGTYVKGVPGAESLSAEMEIEAAEAVADVLDGLKADAPKRKKIKQPALPKRLEGEAPAPDTMQSIDRLADSLAKSVIDPTGPAGRIVREIGNATADGGGPLDGLAMRLTEVGDDLDQATTLMSELGLDPAIGIAGIDALTQAIPLAREKLDDMLQRQADTAARKARAEAEIKAVYGGNVDDAMADAEFVKFAGPDATRALWQAHKDAVAAGGAGGGKTIIRGGLEAEVKAAKKELENHRAVLDALAEARRAASRGGTSRVRAAAQVDVERLQAKQEEVLRAIGKILDSIGATGPLDEVLPLLPPEIRGAWVRKALWESGNKPPAGFIDGLSVLLTSGMDNALPADFNTLVTYGLTFVPEEALRDFRNLRKLPTTPNAAVKTIQYIKNLWQSWFLSSPLSVINDMAGNTLTYTVMGGYDPRVLKKYGAAYLRWAADNDEAVARLVKRGAKNAKDEVIQTQYGALSLSRIAEIARERRLVNVADQTTDRDLDVVGPLQRLTGPAGKVAVSVRDNAYALRELNDNGFRFAAYVQELADGRSFEDAASRVRSLFPDYSDVTRFERDTARRTFMFYVFTRKMVPFVLRSMIEKPYRFKMLAMMSGMTATDNEDFPEWNQRLNGLHLYNTPEGVPVFGSIPGALTNSVADLLEGNLVENMVRNTNPLFRSLAEIATDRDFFTGLPIGFQEENRQKVLEGRGADYAPAWLKYVPGSDKVLGFTEKVDTHGKLTGYEMDSRLRWIFESGLPLGQWSRAATIISGADDRKPTGTAALAGVGVTLRSLPQGTPTNVDLKYIQQARNRLAAKVMELPGKPLTVVNGIVTPNRKTAKGLEVATLLDKAEEAARLYADTYRIRGPQRTAMIDMARLNVFKQTYPQIAATAEALQRLADAYEWAQDPERAARRAARRTPSGASSTNEEVMDMLSMTG